MSKRLSNYIASFDYFDKSLILLSATSGAISNTSFATATEVPVGIASASASARNYEIKQHEIKKSMIKLLC